MSRAFSADSKILYMELLESSDPWLPERSSEMLSDSVDSWLKESRRTFSFSWEAVDRLTVSEEFESELLARVLEVSVDDDC